METYLSDIESAVALGKLVHSVRTLDGKGVAKYDPSYTSVMSTYAGNGPGSTRTQRYSYSPDQS